MSRTSGTRGAARDVRPATSWAQVAADGTDPARLARVVARRKRSRGGAGAVTRRAAELELAHGPTEPVRLLDRAVGEVDGPSLAAAEDVARRWAALGVRAALVGDAAYPSQLAAGWPGTGGPPLLAWRHREDAPLPERCVAIVGARRATGYGTGVAAWLAEAAGEIGITVVSGGAVGIDAAAHRAAAPTDGRTVVVLGCGHDIAYPRPHAAPGGLFDQILDAGGWITSELLPDVRTGAGRVLARNRIVAGLSQAVVVVEGGARSGSLRTAADAADRGVPVLAVPGDVRAPGSTAPHRLLAEGAAPCTDPSDLLDIVNGPGASAPQLPLDGDDAPGRSPDRSGSSGRTSSLPEPAAAVLRERWPRPVPVDELAARSGVPVGTLLAAVTRAEVVRQVVTTAEGIRLTRKPG